MVSAINYKLFEGGADTAVNTASELQSYVDSANEIVNKIQNWAEPDWSGIGTSASYISLVPKFANANFEEGSGGNIPGWVTYNDWVDLGVTQLAGYTSPQDPVAGPLNTPAKGGQAQEVAEDWTGGITSRSISVTLQENYDAQHGSVVVLDTGELSGTAGNRWNTGTANNIFHGPAIWSEGTVKLKAGASVAIDFRAINAGDAADVYGYLLNVDTGQHIDLLDFNPYVDGENQDWQTASVTLTAGQDGEYRFVFVGGSNNGDNGGTSGGKFIIDNILVDSPPEKFNGVVSTNNEADYVNVQSVFDGEGYVDSNSLAFTSDTPAAPGSTVELGWYDQGDFGFDPAVADTLIIHPKNTGTDFSKLPVDFDVMGWDNDTAQWELIKSFAPSENVQATTTTTGISGSAYEVQTIASPTINNSGYYTLEIGSNRVFVQLDGDATVSELAAALDSALTTAGVGVTVAASGSDLTLAWDDQVEVTDVAKLTTQGIVETSDGKALEFDLSDATKAYTGFKIVVRDTLGGDGTVEITELDFQARSLTAADLPSDSEPTWQEYSQIGVVGVTENNLSDINAMVFAQSSKSDVATIPMIQAIVDNYIASMSIIEAFTNGDGAADTNGNFTYDSGETGVPTVADYQNIGVRYVVNGDGLNVPISNANIPAINEVLAQAAYGVDSGDTAISNATELRGVLNSDAVAARLTAINKIASIAQATASELALTAANLADGDAVYLQLTANGVTEEVSATLTSDTASAASLASALNGSLGSDSAFTISENAGDIVITRNDGAAFTVVESAANTSAGTWTLTDTASNVLSASNTSSLAVAATSDLPTIADFTAAGITGVNSETYQPTINDLVAQSAYSNIDTLKEIQEVVDNKTAIFELLTFIDDGELYSEVSDTYNYGLANFDPEETVSSGYYLFDEGASGTWPRILGAEDAFDGTTSTTDNGWWVSEREDVGTGQVDHYGIFGRANYQAYLGYFDRDNSEGPTLVQSVSFANSSVVSHYRGRLQGYDEAKGVWSTIKSFDTGNIESNATYTINVASDYGSSLEKKAYDGYRLVFDETVEGGWTGPRIDVTELYINTKKVLPLATPETFTTAGITGVTDDNIDQIRKVVLESTTADSSIDDVRSVVDGVVVGLQSLQTALASGSLDTITAQTYADVGIDGVADDNIDAINAIAASRQASLNSGETLSISDLQRIADDVTTNFSALLKLAELMGQQSTDNDKLSLAQTLLTADRSYVPDLDAVNATDAQVAINNLLGFTSDSPVSDLEGLGVVAKEIYANWDGTAGSTISPSLGDATDTEHGFTPWEAFNGDVSGSAEGYASTAYVSKDRPGSIGWFDSQGSQGPTVINSFKIDALQDKLPTVFDLYGYNAETEVWEFVQGYDISATYVDETSYTFDVDTFRAYSGFRLDIFAPSQLDAQTGTIDYPNPQDESEALNPDVVITELTFEVNSSDVLVNSGLKGIDDAETLYRVLDAIDTQTAAAASNTDSLAKVKAIAQGVFEAIALEHIVEYLDDQQLATPTGVAAPTVADFTTLGLTTFGTGADEESITDANLPSVLSDLVAMGTAIDTTNSGTASIQGIDKNELRTAVDSLPYVIDTASPSFVSASTSADGTKVILTYDEPLLAATAASSDFAVTSDGNANTVTAVSASGSTVELTLTTPVTNGQAVTVTYTDPAAGDDANAIQDLVGNDAATLASTAVTNTVPVPAARNVTVSNLSLLDDDGDASNGVASMSQTLVANLAGLQDGDEVQLSINGDVTDVTDSVVAGKLAYGSPTTTATITKVTSGRFSGFDAYDIFAWTQAGPVAGGFKVIPVDTDLARSPGIYSAVYSPDLATSDWTNWTDGDLSLDGKVTNFADTDTLWVGFQCTLGTVVNKFAPDLTNWNDDTSPRISFNQDDINDPDIPELPSGMFWMINLTYRDSDGGIIANEYISLTSEADAANLAISPPDTADGVDIGYSVAMDVTPVGDTYSLDLPHAVKGLLSPGFDPITSVVMDDTGGVRALDQKMFGTEFSLSIGDVDVANYQSLSDGDSFDVDVAVIGANPDDIMDMDLVSLFTNTTLTVDTFTGQSLILSQGDSLELTVKDSSGADITFVANTGDNAFSVDLSNPVDFLGVDVDGDGNYSDLYERAVNGIVGNTATGDSEVDVWLDVSDASFGDVIELHIDGQLVATSSPLDQTTIDAGVYQFSGSDGTTTFDLNSSDDTATEGGIIIRGDDIVAIQLRVTNNDTEVQSLTDVTWDYQW
ncbi:SwmB domain-containing protein [Roseobacter sp. HKCCA2468]|uniref:SwmB domain-containing protein n=1 Tax=Roseobacter sp. HKCCA2468 TaxID=3120342 RepID=UPI0030ED5DF8